MKHESCIRSQEQPFLKQLYIGDISEEQSAIFNDYHLHHFFTILHKTLKIVLKSENTFTERK